MLTSLDGTWCLILGAASGMGRATAEAMASEGANIVGLHFGTADRQEEAAELGAKLRASGVEAHLLNANAASAATVGDVVDRVTELTAGVGLRMVLHSLAFGTLLPFLPVGSEAVNRRQMAMTLDVMAHSLVYWVQALFVAQMLPPGAKVFALTSAGDQKVSGNYGAISAAKCALESHVRQLAVELASHGVAVNALRAGVTVTRSLQRIPEHAALIERARANNPHGRLTRPEDVADAVVLLSRSESSWVTGNVIGVDGGELLTA